MATAPPPSHTLPPAVLPTLIPLPVIRKKTFDPFSVINPSGKAYSMPSLQPRFIPIVGATLFDTLSPDEQKRWIKRRSHCGQLVDRYVEVAPGVWRWRKRRFYCGLYQDNFCPSCARWRRRYMERLATRALDQLKAEGRGLSILELSHEDANKLCRRLGKDNYQRRPKRGGKTIMLIPTDLADDDGEEIHVMDDLAGSLWDSITNTPAGLNISGNLGKEPIMPLKDGEIEISTPIVSVSPDTDPDVEAAAVKQAFTEMRSKVENGDIEITEDNVERIIIDLTALIAKNIQARGGKLLEFGNRHITQRVEISSIYLNLGLRTPFTKEEIRDLLNADDGYH